MSDVVVVEVMVGLAGDGNEETRLNVIRVERWSRLVGWLLL